MRYTRSMVAGALLVFATIASAQSFSIPRSVIADGGATSTGGIFAVTGTTGQSATSASSNGVFTIRSGFWTPEFAPTAAGVSIGGQVRTFDGIGIRGVRITLVRLPSGETVSALSSAFGYYRFGEVIAGQVYVLSVESKQFAFEPSSRVISIVDEITNEDFVADPK